MASFADFDIVARSILVGLPIGVAAGYAIHQFAAHQFAKSIFAEVVKIGAEAQKRLHDYDVQQKGGWNVGSNGAERRHDD